MRDTALDTEASMTANMQCIHNSSLEAALNISRNSQAINHKVIKRYHSMDIIFVKMYCHVNLGVIKLLLQEFLCIRESVLQLPN